MFKLEDGAIIGCSSAVDRHMASRNYSISKKRRARMPASIAQPELVPAVETLMADDTAGSMTRCAAPIGRRVAWRKDCRSKASRSASTGGDEFCAKNSYP
jgi:hypothetical protein